MNTTDSLFIPGLPPAEKHPAVFQRFDALKNGDSFLLINDHDPRPLYYQMIAERGRTFQWESIEEGPRVWRVRITKDAASAAETIGQMVAKDIAKAAVFKKWGIDFCCGGKKTLEQACSEKGLDARLLKEELLNTKGSVKTENRFTRWELDFLADYIYHQHHLFYYGEEPVVTELMQKVAVRHAEHFPELQKLRSLYAALTAELKAHFMREENLLFPFIKALVQVKDTGRSELLSTHPSLTAPVQMMEIDHETAGDILAEMRKVTDNYTPPQAACNSLRFLYHKLEALEEDLHQHIHLENNILFPKALAIEKSLRAAALSKEVV